MPILKMRCCLIRIHSFSYAAIPTVSEAAYLQVETPSMGFAMPKPSDPSCLDFPGFGAFASRSHRGWLERSGASWLIAFNLL